MRRILILNYEFPPLGGGGGVAAYKLAKGFIQNGYEVDYLTTGYKGLKKFEVVDGINVYRVPVIGRTELQTATTISMLSYLIAGFLKGLQLCWKYEYDFINTHFVVPTGPLGYVLAKLFDLKNILSLIGGDIYDPTKKLSPHRFWFLRKVIEFFISRADVITAISSDTKNRAQKFYHVTKEIEVIPIPYEPIDFPLISRIELGLKQDKRYLIGVGRMVQRKGFETFIEVIFRLDSSVEGILIGDGPERKALEALADKFGVRDRIIFAGAVDEIKKFQYLSNADIFLLTSIHEGFGIVLQEAMQVGLPIVSTNNGGQIDFIKEGENGFLVNVGDVEMFAQRIEEILKGPTLREKMAKNNLSDLKNFETEAIAQEYIKFL